MGIIAGRGRQRLVDLQYHRLVVLRESLDDYMDGKVSAARLVDRAEKLLLCGLPGTQPPRRKTVK